MEEVLSTSGVAGILTSLIGYGGQLASVFHNHALIQETVPRGFEGSIIILDATIATLKQVLTLLKDEAASDGKKKLFSEEGLKYVRILAKDCATTLAKIEYSIAQAAEDKEHVSRRRRSRRAEKKKKNEVVDMLKLKLDEKEFLEKLENAKWSLAEDDLEDCMERLYELQLHLLLVFQVVTVGALSQDVSSGKVDVKSIATYHDRVNRTAGLLGITPPKSKSKNRRRRRSSFTDSEYSSSLVSDTDSDSSSLPSRKIKIRRGPPPTRGPPVPGPPPPGWPGRQFANPPPACFNPPPPPNFTPPRPGPPPIGPIVPRPNFNPPSYAESHPPTSPSTLIGTVSSSPTDVKSSGFPNEKSQDSKKTEVKEDKKAAVPVLPDGSLFKTKPNSISFKVKSLFRSKASLAAEMQRVLSETNSMLTAYILMGRNFHPIPHSAFHGLEATHMRTILAQMNDNTWYNTFTLLNPDERSALDNVAHPWIGPPPGTTFDRDVVVLKILHHNKFSAWVRFLTGLVSDKMPFAHHANGRIVLTILRDKLVNGKPQVEFRRGMPPPTGPPRGPLPPPQGPPRGPPCPPPLPPSAGGMRPPPGIVTVIPQATRISDLNGPPPPPCLNPSTIRNSNITPITDHEAAIALTSYAEFTLRPALAHPGSPSPFSRITIHPETNSLPIILSRISTFTSRGFNVIDSKLRLTEPQSLQVSRVLDDLRLGERDGRFEWCLVEISLYGAQGEIVFNDTKPNMAGTATLMHVIAKRELRRGIMALDVWNTNGTMRGPPMPIRPPVGFQPPKPANGPVRVNYESDTESSRWNSSDSSVGQVRRYLRKYQVRRVRRERYEIDSESEDSDKEDVIKIKVALKRGEDVVDVLLDLWTSVGGNGKGKGKDVGK